MREDGRTASLKFGMKRRARGIAAYNDTKTLKSIGENTTGSKMSAALRVPVTTEKYWRTQRIFQEQEPFVPHALRAADAVDVHLDVGA